jgi:hypothetical protein
MHVCYMHVYMHVCMQLWSNIRNANFILLIALILTALIKLTYCLHHFAVSNFGSRYCF